MPFQMTHLHIAKKIYELNLDKIKNRSQFYLGAVAPDAVHNRSGYISDFKKLSHLCVGDEKWGLISNNDEWIENVLVFLKDNGNSDNYDFILGYCCHILSDIYNNKAVWTPFKLSYPEEQAKGYGGLYHKESGMVEVALALKAENESDFWIYLEQSEAITLENIIFADEINEHKANIVHNWFKGKELQDLSSNELVTVQSTMKFIDEATEFIQSKINED